LPRTWNIGMSKTPSLAGMISKGSFSFIDFLVNTVLPVDQSPSFREVNIPLFHCSSIPIVPARHPPDTCPPSASPSVEAGGRVISKGLGLSRNEKIVY